MTVPDIWIERLAHLAADCRPTGARRWDIPGTMAAIRKVQHIALPDVAAAVIRGAADRSLDTPAAIANLRSSAWRERLTEPIPTKPRICPTHSTQYAGPVCPSCRADELAADTGPTPPTRPQTRPAESVKAITDDLRTRLHAQPETP
jgi:hypothetical protein